MLTNVLNNAEVYALRLVVDSDSGLVHVARMRTWLLRIERPLPSMCRDAYSGNAGEHQRKRAGLRD